MNYDLIIIGGSFAGLNFARVAAVNGLKVLVIEKQNKIAEHISSTGIFIKEVIDNFEIPKRFCTNPVCKMHLYSPSLKLVTLSSKTERFYMTDTKGYLKWLGKECEKWGVHIITNSAYIDAKYSGKNVIVKFKEKNRIRNEKCKFLVGADGSLSSVAKSFNLSKNNEILVGIEHIFIDVKGVDKDSFYCFLDYDLAPGYMCWVAPNREKTYVGLAGYKGKFNPDEALEEFKKKIKKYFNFSKAKIIEKKGGLIPVGGMLKKTYANKCLLLGDAAGMVDALPAGGIFPSLSYSTKAAEYIADYILNNNNEALGYYYNYSRELRDHLGFSYHLRTVYNMLNSNKKIEDVFNLLTTGEGKRLMQKLFFTNIRGHTWRTIFLGFGEFLRDPKAYPLFGKMILDEIT